MKDIEAQITECENNLLEAIRNMDVVALDELLHEKLLFNLPDGRTQTKAFDLETYRSGQMLIKCIKPVTLTINVVDSETAVVATTIDLNAVFYTMPIAGKFRYLRVWKDIEGKWQVIAGSVVHATEQP